MIVRRSEISPIDFGGIKIYDMTGDEGLSSSVAFIEVPVGASHALARSSRSDKYYLVIEGTVQFVLGAEETELSSGDFCFVPMGSKFCYRNLGPSNVKLVLMHTPSFVLSDEKFLDNPDINGD